MRKLLSMIVGLAVAGTSLVFADNVEGKRIGENLLYSKQASVDIWADFAAESFAGGEGTQESPYRITNAAELAKIAEDVRAGLGNLDYKDTYFVIENDIDLAGHMWFPIGFMSSVEGFGDCPFAGKIDGQGYSIKNLNMELGGLKGYGLIGYGAPGFELRNLTILSGDIKGDFNVGSLIGQNAGIVENCVNYASVKCLQFYAGGIAGNAMKSGQVLKCMNFGVVQAGFDDTLGFAAGGIAGLSSSIIEQCANFGEIYSRTNYAAGIVGFMDGGKIVHSFNRGNVKAETETSGGIAGTVAGRSSDCEISNNYSACEIIAGDMNAAAGLVGLALFPQPNVFLFVDNYFNFELYTGRSAIMHDNYGKYTVRNNQGLYTDEMHAADFVTTLNNESGAENIWSADVNNINGGYPVLDYMKDYVVGISEVNVNDEVLNVVAENNTIKLLGEEESAPVQVISINGSVVFNGTAAQLASVYFKEGLYIVKANAGVAKVIVK